jgi:hypothetical protein
MAVRSSNTASIVEAACSGAIQGTYAYVSVPEGVVMAEGVCHTTGNGQNLTPGIVGVMDHGIPAGIDKVRDVHQAVADIIVSSTSLRPP